MTKILSFFKGYIRCVDTANRWVGKGVMYLIFVMMGILLFAAISRSFFDKPYIWVMEMAQFTMAAYYLLGGGFSMMDDAHVRMDVFYERWSPKKKAIIDAFTAIALIFYLVILAWGGFASSGYALEYDQRNYTAWGPPMAPIKIIMSIGVILMLLQAFSMLFKDLIFLYDGKEEPA